LSYNQEKSNHENMKPKIKFKIAYNNIRSVNNVESPVKKNEKDQLR